ncbi:hypothetical protein TYRP_013947 [Tyrophagus putrescentiae]|nr:hypothetical protein TYRP_013947 [Tyrophagus putrescentiae]
MSDSNDGIDHLSQSLPENLTAIVRRLPLTHVLSLKEAFNVKGAAPQRCIATIEEYFASKKGLYLMVDNLAYVKDLQYSRDLTLDGRITNRVKLPELDDLEDLPMANEADHALNLEQIEALEKEAMAVYWNSNLKDVFSGVRTLKIVLRQVESDLDHRRLEVLNIRAQNKLINMIILSPKLYLNKLASLVVNFSAQLVRLRIHIANRPSSADSWGKYFYWNPDDVKRLFSTLNSVKWPQLEHFALSADNIVSTNTLWPRPEDLQLHLLSDVSECFLRLPLIPILDNLARLQENYWLERLGLAVKEYHAEQLSNKLLACNDPFFLAKIEYLFLSQTPGSNESPIFWRSYRLNEMQATVEKIRLFSSLSSWDFIARHSPVFFTSMLASLATLPALRTLATTVVLDFRQNLSSLQVPSWRWLRLNNVTVLQLSIYAEGCTVAERAGYPGLALYDPPPRSPFNHKALLETLGGGFPAQFPALRELSLSLYGRCSLCNLPILQHRRCTLGFIKALKTAITVGRLNELRQLNINHPHFVAASDRRLVKGKIDRLLEKIAGRREEAAQA